MSFSSNSVDNRMFPGVMYCEGRIKPKFRGLFHVIGLLVLLPIMLVKMSKSISSLNELCSILIMYIGTMASWGASSLFHRKKWTLENEIKLQRLDHSAVFLNIGANYTSVALLVLSGLGIRTHLVLIKVSLFFVWSACLFGVWHVYHRYSERMTHFLAASFLSLPSLAVIVHYLTAQEVLLMALSGVFHVVGAAIYSKRLVDPFPHTLGYHEVFHICTVLAAACSLCLLQSLCQPVEARCSLEATPMLDVARKSVASLVRCKCV